MEWTQHSRPHTPCLEFVGEDRYVRNGPRPARWREITTTSVHVCEGGRTVATGR
jgi:hypothetical protein